MIDKEMTELDVWIAVNLFGYRWTDDPDGSTIDDVKQVWITEKSKKCVVSHTWQYGVATNLPKTFNHQWKTFQPTRDPANAFEVLRKCNELFSKSICRWDIQIAIMNGQSMVSYKRNGLFIDGIADTLEMAICDFAKKMFEKKL